MAARVPAQWLHQRQQAFSRQVRHFIRDRYGPVVTVCLRNRYLTVAVGIAILVMMIGYVASGRMGFVLMPETDSDRVRSRGGTAVWQPAAKHPRGP